MQFTSKFLPVGKKPILRVAEKCWSELKYSCYSSTQIFKMRRGIAVAALLDVWSTSKTKKHWWELREDINLKRKPKAGKIIHLMPDDTMDFKSLECFWCLTKHCLRKGPLTKTSGCTTMICLMDWPSKTQIILFFLILDLHSGCKNSPQLHESVIFFWKLWYRCDTLRESVLENKCQRFKGRKQRKPSWRSKKEVKGGIDSEN